MLLPQQSTTPLCPPEMLSRTGSTSSLPPRLAPSPVQKSWLNASTSKLKRRLVMRLRRITREEKDAAATHREEEEAAEVKSAVAARESKEGRRRVVDKAKEFSLCPEKVAGVLKNETTWVLLRKRSSRRCVSHAALYNPTSFEAICALFLVTSSLRLADSLDHLDSLTSAFSS